MKNIQNLIKIIHFCFRTVMKMGLSHVKILLSFTIMEVTIAKRKLKNLNTGTILANA